MKTADFKAGQTYICTKSDRAWWTVGKEYTVVLDMFNEPILVDDEGDHWDSNDLSGLNNYFKSKEDDKIMNSNELITLTRIDETTVYVNINHIAAFYHNKAWEYTIVILSDGTQLDIKDSVESIAKYF